MEKILQFGEGNFLRAFAECLIQKAKDCGENLSVAITQPRTSTKVLHALTAQKCSYPVYIRGRQNGNIVQETVRIDCVTRCIDGVSQYDSLTELFKSDELEIVISNTTEAGICYDETNDNTFPAKLTKLLFQRCNASAKPLVFLPTELIEHNGGELKKCMERYALLWNFGDPFMEYLNACSFCNTLVDRIVTGHPDGDSDPCSVVCEPYASWVIEADERARGAITFARHNREIRFCKDLNPYRERKVKLLNGTHTMSVLAGHMCGFEIVRDMMKDDLFSRYIALGMEELRSTIALPKGELDEFSAAVTERFCNPFIDHKLLDIALNSVSKFKARCLPAMSEYYRLNGTLPIILTFSLAALLAFYKQSGAVRDSEEMKQIFKRDAADILDNAVWGTDMTFCKDAVCEYLKLIVEKGMKEAVKEVTV